MSTGERIDFAAMLASGIHDMKNSLGMVLNSLETIVDADSGKCHCTAEQVGQLHYEAKRVNDNLVQLLTLYKMDNGHYGPTIGEAVVAEFLEDCYLLQKPLLDYRGIETTLECDEDLVWYFDAFLIESVLNNVVNNTVRYTRDRLAISACRTDGYLRIDIEDNGPGFPEHMLIGADRSAESLLELGETHTRLGLYFCSRIARSHVESGRHGHIELSNDSRLDGGRFSIYLP